MGVPVDTDPCVVNPTGGFRGTENRLYRVEVHTGGPLNATTVKWSRDNASIVSTVTAIDAGRTVLTVSRVGRDSTSRFQPQDWAEITDDFREFAGLPGEMRKVLAVDDVLQTITLQGGLTAGVFDTVNPVSRHTRIKKWDQKGLVLDSANAVVADVDASGGVIPIPPGGSFVLEDGVQVSFSVDPAGGTFHALDYWNFAARTVDASIEILTAEPPRGILHHLCKLALITFPQIVIDCRTLWPPDFGGDQGCDCTACVSAEEHNSGTFTIQMAIDQVKPTGGKVCLGPGIFNLTAPLAIIGAQSLQVEGKGWRTMLLFSGPGAAVGIAGSIGVEIRELLLAAFSSDISNLAIGILNSLRVRIENCEIIQFGGNAKTSACIGLAGIVFDCAIRDNILFGAAGIVNVTLSDSTGIANQSRTALFLFALKIDDNLIAATQTGVRLDRFTLHLGETRISRNSIYGAAVAGVQALGFVGTALISNSRVDVIGNELMVSAIGIQVGCDSVRVSNNDIGTLAPQRGAGPVGGTGVVVSQGLLAPPERVQILANRITRMGGNGIQLVSPVGSAIIKDNIIDSVGLSGIVMEESSRASELSIENNQLLRIAAGNNQAGQRIAAVRVVNCRQVEVTSNGIDQVGVQGLQLQTRFGIEVVACQSVSIRGNDISNVGPAVQFLNLGAGILVQSPFDRLDISDNSVRRVLAAGQAADSSQWYAVRIGSLIPSVSTNPAGGANPNLLFPFVTNVGNNTVAMLGSFVLAAVPLGREIASLRGNLFEAVGLVEAVSAQMAGVCQINDNRCLATHTTAGAAAFPVVNVTAGTVIADANFVQHFPSNDAFVALRLATTAGPFTVLGNICIGGRIFVNNVVLAAPWQPLNAVTF